MVKIELMKLRHPGDMESRGYRSDSTVAEAVLTLLEVRAATFTNSSDPLLAVSGREMSNDQIRVAWNNRLQELFHFEMHDHQSDDYGDNNRTII